MGSQQSALDPSEGQLHLPVGEPSLVWGLQPGLRLRSSPGIWECLAGRGRNVGFGAVRVQLLLLLRGLCSRVQMITALIPWVGE